MSDHGSRPPDPEPTPGARALLETLESISELLGARIESEDDIPVLREIVLPQTASEPVREAGPEPPPLPGSTDLFDAREFADRLLDASWKQESEAMLDAAREHAAAAVAGRPVARSARAREFQHRVHTEVGPRLESLMEASLVTLRHDLLEILRTELERLAEDCFGSAASAADATADRPPFDNE